MIKPSSENSLHYLAVRKWRREAEERLRRARKRKRIDEMTKKYLVGEESCPGCREAKKYLKEELDKGEFEFVDIDSELGQDIDKVFNFREIPQCVIKDDNGKYQKCDLEKEIEESLKRKGRH